MVDIHSHILPEMDDGSKSEEESLKMLRMLSEQGVGCVVATPHFYANNESVSTFLKRRAKSHDSIRSFTQEGFPEILLGAEVRYYEGISHMDNLSELCIQGTDVLLLEMYSGRWGTMVIRELIDMAATRKMTLVLAHIERYMQYQPEETFETLLDNGVLMQINASYVTNLFTRHKALKMLRDENVHFLGSDCHDCFCENIVY